MKKRDTLKKLNLKKVKSDVHQHKQEWSLPPQYLKLLLFLGLVRKVTKDTTKQIRKNEDKTNNKVTLLKKMYGGGRNNSFDSIAPAKKKIIEFNETNNLFCQLKKEMLNFLKKVKDSQPQDFKKIQSLTQMDDKLPQPKDIFFKTVESRFIYEPQQDNHEISLRNKSTTFASKSSQKIFKYVSSFRKTQNIKAMIMNASRLKTRIKVESDVFKKFNSTLSKYYHIPGTDGTVKGGFELIQLYLNNLFEAKNCSTIRLRSSNKKVSQFRERIQFEVESMIDINQQIFNDFKEISKSNQAVSQKLIEIETKYQNYRSSRESEENQNPVVWLQFGKKINFMIEVTKILISLPTLNRIITQKAKFVGELFQKMSQFRYLSRYFCLEISNMHKSMRKTDSFLSKNKQNESAEYENKWKKVFTRKFEPLKMKLRHF